MRKGSARSLLLLFAGILAAVAAFMLVARQPRTPGPAPLRQPLSFRQSGAGPQAPAPRTTEEALDIPPEVGRITQAAPLPMQQMMKRQNGVIQVILTDRGIRPPTIRVPVHSRVKLHVVNRGGAIHNLVIPDFSVFGHNMSPGEETYVEFNANRVGSFAYYSDTGHLNVPEKGLSGILQVTQ